jgi:hypothetical protein
MIPGWSPGFSPLESLIARKGRLPYGRSKVELVNSWLRKAHFDDADTILRQALSYLPKEVHP